jgi:prepilin peptidase CpaA
MPLVVKIVLLCTVLAAGVYDLRYRRIPNWLNVSAMSIGVALNLLLFAGHGVVFALLGIGCSLLVYIPLYLVRGMGAGDVKLMAAVGAIAGPRNWLGIFLATAILGGIVSFIYVLSRRRMHETLLNLSIIVTELLHARAPVIRDPNLDVRSAVALRMPHGALIAVGVVTFLIFSSHFLTAGG